MNNQTIETIRAHGSCRRYRDDPVPDEYIETIVDAGQRSSTSSNLQAYSVVAVTDATRRKTLGSLCGEQEHVFTAPVFLAWCADLSRLDAVCATQGMEQSSSYVENFLVAAMDAAIAAQNAAIAAESLGLGICYIGAIRNNPREVITLLGLPRLVFPVTGMTIGWPLTKPRVRPRIGRKAILHRETYDSDQDEELFAYDRIMQDTGIYSGRQILSSGQAVQDDGYGWLKHSARRVAEPTRAFLRDVLKEQGFLLQ
jgi:FMN reductase (NADPH)